jgi:hypothetical protein
MKRVFTMLWIVILAAGLSLSGGCAVVESEDVKTSGMWAHFVIDHHPDDQVVAWAVLRVGGQTGTIIDMVGDDYLEVNGTRMTEYVEVITNFHWNRAVITPDPDGIYDFTFNRVDETVTSYVTTPAFPTIISTVPDITLNAGTNLEVTWDDTDPAHHVNFFLYGSWTSGSLTSRTTATTPSRSPSRISIPRIPPTAPSPWSCAGGSRAMWPTISRVAIPRPSVWTASPSTTNRPDSFFRVAG